ncbi:heme-binding domain-containing protein [Halobacteriovorax sp. HLS]|uniref:heme-binding domain-containing protein n=1 Tax=Halobacteriovorax sp. HLS TaxID=2234000 RepID=UPI000FDBAC04|nr:heme-binding domain-containing protein [Halobacteriovorax sp. HLS]
MKVIGLLFMYICSFYLYAHGGVEHDLSDIKTSESKEKNKLINELYVKNVKAIFKKACFDCHSSQTVYPSYYNLPLIKELIDKDIKDAKWHLVLDGDYPFRGHGSKLDDLSAIERNLDSSEMPPLRYRIFNSSSTLSKSEVETVRKWINQAREILK